MQTYLVGGAVRDMLLNKPIKDRDYVVVGASSAELLAQGFRQVGKDFPVFLHPETGEEHALARLERKVGPGHGGFVVETGKDVSLEDDLIRRDLTINAIAFDDATQQYVDPFGGQADLDARILRHVSLAFAEDPLRVLRVARFAARYADLGFTVAPQTMDLMREMVKAGELNHLTAERVWSEVSRAMGESHPQRFLQVLHACGALDVILPEVHALYGVPQVAEHHPEVDTGVHVEMVLAQAAKLAPGRADIGFAALVHDLGKGITPDDVLPQHLRHEETGVPLVQQVCERLRVPAEWRALAVAVCKNHLTCHRAMEIRSGTVMALFESIDAFRHPPRFEAFVQACEADARGRLGLEDRQYPQADFLRTAFAAAQAVNAKPFVEKGLVGVLVGEAVKQARVRAISGCRTRAEPWPELPGLVESYRTTVESLATQSPEVVLDMFGKLNLLHRPHRAAEFLAACEDVGIATEIVRECFDRALSVNAYPFVEAGLKGAAVGVAVREARLDAVASVLAQSAPVARKSPRP